MFANFYVDINMFIIFFMFIITYVDIYMCIFFAKW